MKILITNDDGIKAPGIKLLIRKAKKYGQITVIAPRTEKSATSHSIEIRKGVDVIYEGEKDKIKYYSVESSPADCVRYAKYGLNLEYDIVLSGINNGYNLGENIFYSGTVAAATEAVLTNSKALAFSTAQNKFEHIEQCFDDIMEFIFQNKLLEQHSLYNINVPPAAKEIRITKQGYTHFETVFSKENNLYYQKGHSNLAKEIDNQESDVNAIINDCISITPLSYNRTDEHIYNILKK